MRSTDVEAMVAHVRRRGHPIRVETDETGEVRVIAVEVVRASRARIGASITYTAEARLAAWLADPRCAHCQELVDDVNECATVPCENPRLPLRIAHKPNATPTSQRCFVQAVMAANPTFNTKRARERAGE